MLDAGYVLCSRCGHVTSEAYYHNSGSWVQLVRKGFGGFEVLGYTPEYMNYNKPQSNTEEGITDELEDTYVKDGVAAQKEKAHTVYKLKKQGGNRFEVYSHEISVLCYKNGRAVPEEKTFLRSCPFCVKNDKPEPIIEGFGLLPTYIIGVIGSCSVGKSCWIHALSVQKNLEKVNEYRQLDERMKTYFIGAVQPETQGEVRIDKTNILDIGKTRLMRITSSKKGKKKDVAQVLMLDFPGESFTKESFGEQYEHYFTGGEGYSGVDAVVFMMDNNGENTKVNNENGPTLPEVYNVVNGTIGTLRERPIAFVMNKLDLLYENSPAHEIDGKAEERLCIVSKETFKAPRIGMYSKSALLQRVALQSAILKKVSPFFGNLSLTTSSAGFLIKAAEPAKDENGQSNSQYCDFSNPINVMDPLLWILNELDIFPIESDD